MAQDEMKKSPEREIKSGGSNIIQNDDSKKNTKSRGFQFNVHAAEFVPRSYITNNNTRNNTPQMTLSTGYFYPCVQFLQDGDHHVLGTASPADWFYVNPPTPTSASASPSPSPSPPPPQLNSNENDNDNDDNFADDTHHHPPHLFSISASASSKNSLPNDLQQKIIKQVEYLFSDLSLMANDTMAKHVSKDPDGYVPIPVIASMKKIKVLINNDNHMLVQALRSSAKLVVNKDNKKVKRKNPFTENYRDELQCRTVMVENLPDDHSYQNLEKIFRVVGSVKAIRLCHPPEVNPCRSNNSKNEVIISNKLHALVEYENAESAERAAEKLNDERNWRKGMRVRMMLRRSPKSVLKSKKSDFDMLTDDDELTYTESPKATPQLNNAAESATGEQQTPGASRKTTGRGRIKTKGRNQSHNDRGLLSSPTHSIGSPLQSDSSTTTTAKQTTKGPRMPDGTRGFTMGRGKHIITSIPPLHF